MTIVLLRHGQTPTTLEGRFAGRDDTALDDEGRRQAAQLAQRLAGSTFSLVLTSPIVRAVQTGEGAGFGARAEPCADLVEWDYGDLVGRVASEVRQAQPDWSLFEHGAPGGESPAEVAVRVDRVLTRVRDESGPVLVVSHGHLLRTLVARWLGLDPAVGAAFVIDPASVSTLGFQHGQPALVTLNDTAHLNDGAAAGD